MAAKPRVTVRLAPATLHALAYIAERDGLAPAEAARMMVSAQCRAVLEGRGWSVDQQQLWRDWESAHRAGAGLAARPSQADYDALALGEPAAAARSHAIGKSRL